MKNEITPPYLGKISIDKVINERSPAASNVKTISRDLDLTDIKFVHYADSQQLIIWLPNPGIDYHSLRIENVATHLIFLDCPVTSILNGSVQLVFDTLLFSPGNYSIEIIMKDCISHTILFTKQDVIDKIEINVPEEKKPDYSSDKIENRRRYYDSGGKYVEDDIDFRDRKMKELLNNLSPRIEYKEQGRSGTIYYIDGEIRISFDYEFGGGNCIAFIMVPKEIDWESVTQIPVSRRQEIVQFVASTVHHEKVGNSSLVISENAISYYST